MDRRPRQTGATLHPTRGTRFPKEGDAKGAKVGSPALLSATVRPRSGGLFLARPDDGPAEAGDGRVLVVQLREEADAPPPFHGVPSVGPQIRELWRRVGKDYGWEHPRAPALRWLWKDDAVGAVVEFLENTRVGSRASTEMARARVDEDRDGQEGEEDGPGPPWAVLFFVFPLSLCYLPFVGFSFWGKGERGSPV